MKSSEWIHLLVNNPHHYISLLEEIYLQDINKASIIVNQKEYHIWYGNQGHAITHLVGNLITDNDTYFWGSKCPYLDEEMGIKILKLMVLCNVDLNAKDYYQQTPLEIVFDRNNGSITERYNNEN